MSRQIIDPLLESFTLKNLQLRNRVVSTSHEPSYTEDGMPKDRYRLYHVEKAKGRHRADDDGRLGGGRTGEPVPRSATCTSTRTRSCRGCASWPTTCTSTVPG